MRVLALAALLLPGAASAAPIIVQLSLANDGCAFDVTLNGIDLGRGETADVFSTPVNPWLAGKGNQLVVEAKPKPKAEACAIDLKVEALDRATWGTKVLAKGALEKGKTKVELSFDTATDALSAWRKAEPFKDEKALRAYAVKLAQLARDGAWKAWMAESAPRYEQAAAAFQVPKEALIDSEWASFGGWGQMKRALTPGEVVAEPLLDGRLWRLRQKKHPRALLVVQQGDEERAMEIVVGVVDGQLRVVR